jgi:hypothetical protein
MTDEQQEAPMAGNTGEHSAPLTVWIAVAVIIAGSIMSGIALIEWIWPLFWVGVALMVLGSAGGYFSNIMDQVTEYAFPTQNTEIERG